MTSNYNTNPPYKPNLGLQGLFLRCFDTKEKVHRSSRPDALHLFKLTNYQPMLRLFLSFNSIFILQELRKMLPMHRS